MNPAIKKALINALGSETSCWLEEANPLDPTTPTNEKLKCTGWGCGSKYITYENVVGWDQIAEDNDPYVIVKSDAGTIHVLREDHPRRKNYEVSEDNLEELAWAVLDAAEGCDEDDDDY
jgi:hypothetical protein